MPQDETRDNQAVVGKTEKILSSSNNKDNTPKYVGDPNTGYAKHNVFNDSEGMAGVGGFPMGGPLYKQYPSYPLTRYDHKPAERNMSINENARSEFFVNDPEAHFIRDVKQGMTDEDRTGFVDEDRTVARKAYTARNPQEPKEVAVFSGATTNVNPHNDPETDAILKSGTLSKYLEEDMKTFEVGSYNKPPVTPMHPFYRINSIENQHMAEEVLFNSYNRTLSPIADVEWRKGFRHIFITRPECYLMYADNGSVGLCNQALYDEDFNSAYTRMPHIIKLLSPWYVSGSFPNNSTDSNWNFLLSNRVQGMSTASTTMSINENISKSIEGYTITPAMHVESRQGSSLELSFKDTKTLEVYETMRLWMLYMYKRKKGIFIPPYNGYQKNNAFIPDIPEGGMLLSSDKMYTQYHPYDRALEYCASLYDIVTNETGTKILYWCKYYGIYPTSVTPSLNNDANGPIIDMTTSVSFKYHYRLENRNKTLVEFNHDAGLTDDLGRVKESIVSNSLPFLLRDDYDHPVMPRYIGAAGMFTGSPYIVMALSHPDPLDRNNMITVPNLRFMSISDHKAGADVMKREGSANLGIRNDQVNVPTNNVVGLVERS